MLPVAAKYPFGLEPHVRYRRACTGVCPPARDYRPLLIGRLPGPWDLQRRATGHAASRGGAVCVPGACKSLFFPPRRLRFCAAPQHPLVNINENTSAAFSAGGRTGSQPTEYPHENGGRGRVRCNTSGGKTSRTTSEIQAGTRGHGTRGGPVRRPAAVGPCKFLFFHARRPRAQALRSPTGGSPLPAAALVNSCRSLLIARIPGAAEPVRSGDRPVPRHGLSFPPPPPSAREESGERP
jgi:hypothetical protein